VQTGSSNAHNAMVLLQLTKYTTLYNCYYYCIITQVLGHFKTITILVLGFTLFHAPIIPKNLLGVVIAMAGVIMYTEAKRKGSAPAAAAAANSSSSGANGSSSGSSTLHKPDSMIELLSEKLSGGSSSAGAGGRRPSSRGVSPMAAHSALEEGTVNGDRSPLLGRASQWKET
jgi:hypothetical protein